MSRIGRKPVPIAKGAKVSVNGRDILVESSKAKLSFHHRPEVSVKVEENEVVVERHGDSKTARAMHGLTRSLVANMIEGVVNGYKKQLEIVGVGWNAAVKGKTVELNVGYADTRKVPVPDGVLVEVKGQDITVTGPDKQLVGQTAAAIRAHKKPEPYNGKGIKYKDEVILRKAGKAFAGGGK
ncbi:MAG: 50S ribosomal protein L6 [Planctomycetota bacterium]